MACEVRARRVDVWMEAPSLPLTPHARWEMADDPDFASNALWSVMLFPLMSAQEARHIVAVADAHAAAAGWSTRRHRAYPTTDIALEAAPSLRELLGPLIALTILPTLAFHYGFDREALSVYDAFLVKYEAGGEKAPAVQNALGAHRDSSLLSFSVLLSSPDDFEGGGLRFASVGPTCDECGADSLRRATCARCAGTGRLPLPCAVGELTTHCGKLLHEALPVTRGRRVVLVGFVSVRTPGVDVEFVEGSVHANTSTVGGWADREILEECLLPGDG